MKKTLIILTIVTLLCVAAFSFSGCSLIAKVQGKTYVNYVQASRFTAGDMEGDTDFEDILIDWYGGSVNIYQYDGDKLIIKETANQELDDDMKLHWALFDSSDYGKYYSIKYCKKGMWDLTEIKKDLVILVPASMERLNKLSITCRGESDINIYMPDMDVVGDAYGGEYNVHLDTDYGNINAYFKSVDSLRMLSSGKEDTAGTWRMVTAKSIGNIDYVGSYGRIILNVGTLGTGLINTFAGNVYVTSDNNIRSLKINHTTGTAYLNLNTFNKLDFVTKSGLTGVEMYYKQKFVVNMSNYTEYSSNEAYKEPHFMGRIGYVPDDELRPEDPDDLYDVTHTGDSWRVRDGKDAAGRKDVEVNVESGADVYFGSWQSLYTTFVETGVFLDVPELPQPYNQQDPNGNQN